MPLDHSSTRHIEEVEMVARERSRGPLLESLIFGEELTLVDTFGCKHHFDIVLQEKPKGEILKSAVNNYSREVLLEAVTEMKRRLDAIGFLHRNLTPSNIIISQHGVAHPLRYWYAEWEVYSDNDISQLEEYINRYAIASNGTFSSHFMAKDNEAEYHTNTERFDGITRQCRGNRYGFVDDMSHDQTETASYFHLSLSRARHTEKAALNNVRRALPGQ
jgi:hypothetical protein